MSPADPHPDFESQLEDARRQLTCDPQLALSRAQELLDARTDARAIRIIAEAHRKLGNPREAETAELAAIRASGRDPHLRRATLANQQEHWEQAETLVRTY